ncbi:BTAD domain-containing putative transcriptional regulator [Micromonospora lupini]|uniref:Putative transcriptional activator domain protein n=1 Tax=Micromonospora lupini str. Lupac 08 TaxID=1150864 RepID=I0L4F5_9ACTN|nr:BTAD domain-containing putative transcriptional regulator [Micromonospora lupini]CCH18702.1 Putative transcriptional activator domain protein [Micromonospora lupini str. Lupac 08]
MATEQQRWLMLVAAAGYGKTTALEAAGGDGPTVCHRALDLLDAAARTENPPPGRVLVDEVSALAAPDQLALVRLLTALPGRPAVTLAARHPLADEALSAIAVPVVDRGPATLALGRDAVARVLRDEHAVADSDLAYLVYELTAGWPAWVHLAGDALGRQGVGRRDLLAALTEPGTAGGRFARDEVLADLPPHVTRLLRRAHDLDPISAPLCEAVDTRPTPGATADALRWSTSTGLLVAHPRRRTGRTPQTFQLVRVLATVLAQQTGPPDAGGRRRLRAAADWYLATAYPLAAARALLDADEPGRCADLIASQGGEMLAHGGAPEVTDLVSALPQAAQSPDIRLILGDALRMSGAVTRASRVFTALLAQAERDRRWPSRLLWRAAMVPYLRADYPGALAVLDLADTPPTVIPSDPDDVLLLACRASTLAQLGRVEDAVTTGAHALAAAHRVNEDGPLAAAHIAAALMSSGTRRDAHLADALAAAERAGDLVQQARVLVNQAHCLLREARYPPALGAAVRAVRAAELAGPPGVLVTALHNAGEALVRLGRYDEAALHFTRSKLVSQRLGLNRAAAGVYGTAEVNRRLGRREEAMAAFTEAVELARDVGDLQVLIPALTGLARLRCEGRGADLAAARAAADEAHRLAPAFLLPSALVAVGWVAYAGGDLESARLRAAEAVGAARAGRQSDALAEALELTAAVAAEPAASRDALREAGEIWRTAGACPAAEQTVVLLGRIPGADGSQRSAARLAANRLLALGVETVDGRQLAPPSGAGGTVEVRVLGGFEVVVGGREVPLPAWRSRQARTLLKILVARRGRAVGRAELSELLWPDDEPRRTAHRLSVLLSAVRAVLDPSRLWPADRYVRADLTGVRLDLTRVSVDAETLLADAPRAERLARDGDPGRAREMLAEVDATYRGDAFADEPYEDWADGLREQARAVWLRALRDLARLYRRDGAADRAATTLVRLLDADPYDEWAHRTLVEALVGAGRHGEARRAFDRWAGAMRAIDAPPPEPAVLRGRTAQQL